MTHVHEDIGAYVLGGLDSDSERRVREHLATCAECAQAHAELAGIPALLDLAVMTGATEDEPLPPAIEERLLDRFARERDDRPARPRWRPRLAFGFSSALAGAAIAVAALIFGLHFQHNGARSDAQYRLAFERVGPAPVNASARAGLQTSAAGTVVRLSVHNLPGGPKDVYEVFCDAPGWSASAGTFRVDAKGNAYVILTTAVTRGQYDKIRVVRREHLASGKIQIYDMFGAKLS
jgi:anti-sigma factor RsiW